MEGSALRGKGKLVDGHFEGGATTELAGKAFCRGALKVRRGRLLLCGMVYWFEFARELAS